MTYTICIVFNITYNSDRCCFIINVLRGFRVIAPLSENKSPDTRQIEYESEKGVH